MVELYIGLAQALQESRRKTVPQTIESVRCSVTVPGIRETFVEAFGPLTHSKNIGLQIAKELYSADS